MERRGLPLLVDVTLVFVGMEITGLRVIAAAAAVLLSVAGCSSDDESGDAATTSTAEDTIEATTTTAPVSTTTPASSTTTAPLPPEPLDDQTPPDAVNGLEVEGDTIWLAAATSSQVLQVDRLSGAILTRVDGAGSSPDDLTVGPDGAVYWTGFADGSIGRIVDGATETIANIGPGANPIGFTEDGELIAGRAVTADGLYRVPLDGGEPEVIAETLGDMNAFVIEGDRVVGPVGGVLGPGGVSAVDLATGEVTELGTDFPSGVTASTADPDGRIHLLSANGQVWLFDEASGSVEPAVALADGIYDNLDFAPDGTLYVTHFTEPVISVVAPDGTRSTLAIGS